ncbi:retrovirus-related pol polyprotein from transposon TNT 1-94, partial [Tanacetum coccineum]
AHWQEQLRTRCAQASDESYLPNCCGLTEEHQLLQGLHDALDISSANDNNPFVAPPSSDTVIESVRKDGREVFGMPIPEDLLTDAIKRAPYYGGYLAHVIEYQRHLDPERDMAEEEAAPESLKATKVTKPAKDSKPTSSQPPKPKPVHTKPSKAVPGKKRKLVKQTSNEPSLAKRSKGGLVGKRHKPKSPIKLVDEFVDEGVPVKEPTVNAEEANIQRALELSLKELEERTQGPARPVMFREPDSGRFQPLSYVQGKGKEKRRTPMSTESTGKDESPFMDAKLAMTDSEMESDEEEPLVNSKKDASYRELTKINTRDQDEGQAGPNPGKQDEGQAGSNPGNAAEPQPQSSHVVHENLKLPTKDQEEEPKIANTESEVQSKVSVPIHQDTSSVPLMTTLVIDLTVSQPVSTTV